MIDLDGIRKRLVHVTQNEPVAFLSAYLEALATKDVPALLTELERLQAQSSDLLAALKEAREAICSEYCGTTYHAEPCRKAFVAIAKAEKAESRST